MVHSPGFFDPKKNSSQALQTKENHPEITATDPKAFIEFLNKAFESGEIVKGHHLILGSLFIFYINLEKKAYEGSIIDRALVNVLETLKKGLYEHYQSFANTCPDECLVQFKEEIASGAFMQARHRVLNDITALKDSLTKDNPVYQLLHPMCERARYLKLAKVDPLTVSTFLKEAFEKGDIKEGEHPLLGRVLDFAYDTSQYCRNNEITLSIKTALSEHYQRLAHENPALCIEHIKAEDTLKRFKDAKHFMFGDIKAFCGTLTNKESEPVLDVLRDIETHERLKRGALYRPKDFIEALKKDFEEGKIVDGKHAAYGDLKALAHRIYKDVFLETAMEGKHPVLAYLESKGIWAYPLPTENPIKPTKHNTIIAEDIARKLADINAYWKRQSATQREESDDREIRSSVL